MIFYPFNIGEYRKDTLHLSATEHGIYRTLLDSYYLNEGPLPADDEALMRKHCVRTKDEKSAYFAVIKEFFFVDQNMYRHNGCDKVIAEVMKKSEKARASARLRWDRNNANAMRTDSERNANGMLLKDKVKDKDNITPAKQSKKITLGKYLEQCKESGVKAIPADHALFDYCEKQSLPEEFVFICWRRFVDYYRDGIGNKKTYIDWPTTFLNNVKNNYYKLWYLDGSGQYLLTTAGKQAQKEFADHE